MLIKIKKEKKIMISLEMIIVLSLLVYIVKKISVLVICWIKGFYLINSIIFIVNSYINSGFVPNLISSEFNNELVISSEKNKLVIVSKEDLPTGVEDSINNEINNNNNEKKYKVSIHDNKKIEIVSNE